MQQKTLPVVYKGSRYAERLPIGEPEIIKNSDYSIFKRFYKDWYRPDLMAVVVVGDVDPAQVEMQIKESFGQIPSSLNPRERKEYEVPRHLETLISIASDEEASFTNVNVMNKLPKAKTKTMGDMRASILRSAYNGMFNERLEEIGKEADPPFVFAYTGYSGDVGDIDSYSSFAMVPEGKSIEALERLLLENKRVLEHGFTASELERQKKNMMESAERRYKEMDKTNSGQLAMRYVYNYLDDNPIPSPSQILKIYKQYLPGITVEEINELPSQWISEENRVITITGPDKFSAPIPTEADVKNVLENVAVASVEPFVDDVIEGPLLDKELVPAGIKKEMKDEMTGITTFILQNGVKVYLKPTTFKNDEILMSANSEGGSSLYPDSTYFDASQAGGIINASGIGKFNSTQLDKLMSGKTAYVSPYIGTYYEGLNGGAAPKDVEEMFKMVYLYFTDVRKDEKAFESFINRQIGIYKNLQSNPSYYFSDYASRLKFRNHPRVGFPSIYDFQAIDHDRVLQFYKERFADASDFTFTLVGNFEEEKMKMLAQKYLGNLPSINREETWKDIGLEYFPGQLRKTFKNGEAPKTQVELFFHGDFEYTPENAYKFNSMLDYLKIKLREELREDKGGVYGVGLFGSASKTPRERYSITISFNSDPDRTKELIDAAKGVIRTAQKEIPSDQDMTKVKETQRQSRIKNLEENRFWSREIMNIHNNDDLDFNSILLESLDEKINKLKPEDIKYAAGKFFNFQRYVELVMEPEDPPQN
jgi:zinc protease